MSNNQNRIPPEHPDSDEVFFQLPSLDDLLSAYYNFVEPRLRGQLNMRTAKLKNRDLARKLMSDELKNASRGRFRKSKVTEPTYELPRQMDHLAACFSLPDATRETLLCVFTDSKRQERELWRTETGFRICLPGCDGQKGRNYQSIDTLPTTAQKALKGIED